MPGQNIDRTALYEANELLAEAYETEGADKAALARRAIEICPDCADAYVILAEVGTPNLLQARELLEKALDAGRRIIGEEAFRGGRRDLVFWYSPETRPYMRAGAALGDCLWKLGDREAAINLYGDLLNLNPNDNLGLRYALANWLVESGKFEELGNLLRSYLEEDSVDTCLAYTKALLTFHTAPGAAAEADLKNALSRNGYVPTFLLKMEELPHESPPFSSAGGIDEAILYARDSIRAWKSVPGALAWLKTHLSDPEVQNPGAKRESIFRSWIKDTPDHLGAYEELAELLLTLTRYEECAETAQLGIEKFGPTRRLLTLLGFAQLNLDAVEDAVATMEKAVELFPGSRSWRCLAAVFKSAERYEEAIEYYNLAILEAPDAGAYTELAECYTSTDDRRRALENYLHAERLQPENLNNHVNTARALYLLFKEEESLAKVEFVLEREPENYRARSLKLNILVRLQRNDEAIVWGTALAEEYPELAAFPYLLAQAYENADDMESASRLYKKSYELAPDHEYAYIRHAGIARTWPESAEILEAGLEEVPDSPDLKAELAKAYAALGMEDDALALMEEAEADSIELPELERPVFGEVYAEVYFHLGRYHDSMKSLIDGEYLVEEGGPVEQERMAKVCPLFDPVFQEFALTVAADADRHPAEFTYIARLAAMLQSAGVENTCYFSRLLLRNLEEHFRTKVEGLAPLWKELRCDQSAQILIARINSI